MHIIERPRQRRVVEKYLKRGMTLEQIYEMTGAIKRKKQIKKMIFERDYPYSDMAGRASDFYDDENNNRNYRHSWDVFQGIRARKGRNRLKKCGIDVGRKRGGKGYVLWSKG